MKKNAAYIYENYNIYRERNVEYLSYIVKCCSRAVRAKYEAGFIKTILAFAFL